MKQLGWLFLLTLCAAPVHAAPGATAVYPVANDTMMCACSFGAANKVVPIAGIASTAESSAVIQTARFSRIGLRIRMIPAGGDTTTVPSFAIAFKVPAPDSTAGGAADSLAGFWNPILDPVLTQVGIDSVGPSSSSGYDVLAGGGAACGLWPGEMLWSARPWMGRGTLKSDQFFGPTTYWIPLSNGQAGLNIPPRLQVRIRCLRGYTILSGNKPRVQAWLECTE